MPRTKGSKNRPKHTNDLATKIDFASRIAEKQETATSLNTVPGASPLVLNCKRKMNII